MPYGKKEQIDFDELYDKAIFPSPNLSRNVSDVRLFREDANRPTLLKRHKERIEHFKIYDKNSEPQLRQCIQENIIAADFIISVLSTLNSNVLLETGFAQAHRKKIIYILSRDQSKKLPSNLQNLKRQVRYNDLEDLRWELHQNIIEVKDDLCSSRDIELFTQNIEFFPNRKEANLEDRFENATRIIQILTTNLTTVSANYIDAIAVAAKKNPNLEVKILTSDPTNNFINPRAKQLGEDMQGYRNELEGSLKSVKAKLENFKNCEVRTYKDFPVQLWHLIDDHIYVGQSSLNRRTRHNCIFKVSVDTQGIKGTFLDHFDTLWKKYKKETINNNKHDEKRTRRRK